ncbi:MAG: DNA translocase FtsK 4TM domain-containing protein [Anaerolineae bacterium]|nr:DNA translocase FtsK 4TM domain-containing protein [Anaerolineae bacterium]
MTNRNSPKATTKDKAAPLKTPTAKPADTAKKPALGAAKPASPARKSAAPRSEPKPMNIPAPRERRKPSYAIKVVDRPVKSPDGKTFWQRLTENPEEFGKILYDHPSWIDEFFAIALFVFGLVMLFAILNSSPEATLTGQWSDILRQLLGYVGAVIFAVMIIAAGGILILRKLNLDIEVRFRRILWIEVAFFAFLALYHTFLNDPEPRALARSGGGGGYIGWALSQVMISLFGSVVTTLFFGALMVFALGVAVGINRHKVRGAVGSTAKGMLTTADKLRQVKAPKLPQLPKLQLPRSSGAGHVRRAALAAGEADGATTESETTLYDEPVETPAIATPAPVLRPLRPGRRMLDAAEAAPTPDQGVAVTQSPVTPTPAPAPAAAVIPPLKVATAKTPDVAAEQKATSPEPAVAPTPTPLRPILSPAASAKSAAPQSPDDADELDTLTAPKPVPIGKPETAPAIRKSTPVRAATPEPVPVQPRVRRHFTVADFDEVRKPLRRDGLPPVALLSDTELNRPTEDEINNNARIIEDTLLEFDIDVEVVDVNVGPSVTQYAVQPFREVRDGEGNVTTQRVRVQKIAGLSNDLALALSAKRLRIQPFVPGHTYMGIEVPNKQPGVVALRPVLESEAFAHAFRKSDPEAPNGVREIPLAVPLGRDVSGDSVVVDIATMPHLLIAGTTGSGKSVAITAMIVSLLMNNTPERLRMVLLDPKMVELSRFNGVPHLLGPVETDGERIVGVLRWATREMERRYKLLEAEGTRNIETFNRALGTARQAEQLPYIVIVVDEIGDLMLSRPEETERTVTRLAQMARAVGMHLVIATQRPSVDIITGLIKANFPARISFAVASGTDSRVILDSMGAETLMGRGDMLYFASDAAAPRRVQGCYVSDAEIDEVVNYWKKWDAAQPLELQAKEREDWSPWERAMTRREELSQNDPLLEEAITLVVNAGEASTSQIQRQLNIPYPRAANLMDLMTTLGILGASKEGGRYREVLIKPGTDPYRKLMSKIKK